MTEPMKTAQLLLCPFCGTEPEWINEALPDSHYYIRCPHCHIVMKEDRRDKVIGMWSRRSGATVWAEKLKQLETQSHDQVRIIEHLEGQLKQERTLIKDLVGYVIAYKGLASLTSDEDIFIQSLLKKAKDKRHE